MDSDPEYKEILYLNWIFYQSNQESTPKIVAKKLQKKKNSSWKPMVARHDGGDVIVGDEEVWGFETVGVESGEDGGYMIIGGQSIWWIGSGEWRGWW